ncbi:MAG: SUF system NifU family Fe-S cluster assembly protein [Tenericutes bacterium HGW-Tenericutes-2]|jgi:nitrogen fixation NifU-like protein|nr:MAG: SUF system NifU family Fe-S cluster assembly protein [Tenericutes bacterium HGW-Tenericutes-2]
MNIEHLYRQVIMEHYKNPKNKGFVADNSYMTVHLNNPSCGDEMTVQLKIQDHVITHILHQGTGCSICCSSASVMSETLMNKTLDESISILHEFYELIKGYPFNPEILKGDAVVYQGVAQFPARVKCATLAWKAAEQGILKIKEDELNG